MFRNFRRAAAVLSFMAIAGSNFLWGVPNSYLPYGLALVASLLVDAYLQRIFVDRAYREMVRLYGADWSYADCEQPRLLTKLIVATAAVIFAIGFFAFDPRGL